MTTMTTITSTPTDLPIRRIDGIELPTSGVWSLVSTSTVDRSTDRPRGLRPMRVIAGTFDVGDDPAASTLRIDLDDSTLSAATVAIIGDRHGMSEWRFGGTLAGATDTDSLGLTLTYRGVFRRGADSWAWMSGAGTVGAGKLLVDLLFSPPGR